MVEELGQHEFGTLALEVVIHLVEGFANEVDAKAAGLNEVEGAALDFAGIDLHAVVADAEADAFRDLLADEADELVALVLVGVANDVGARLRRAREP